MSRARRRGRRREREEIDWERIPITPRTGALGISGYAPPVIAPSPPRRYVIACPRCAWESGRESTVRACERGLVEHAWRDHSRRDAEAVDVRVRSRKHQFRVEVVDL